MLQWLDMFIFANWRWPWEKACGKTRHRTQWRGVFLSSDFNMNEEWESQINMIQLKWQSIKKRNTNCRMRRAYQRRQDLEVQVFFFFSLRLYAMSLWVFQEFSFSPANMSFYDANVSIKSFFMLQMLQNMSARTRVFNFCYCQDLCSIQSVPDSGNKHDVRWIDHDLGCPVPDAQR